MADHKSSQHRYPPKLRERAVRMVFEAYEQSGERFATPLAQTLWHLRNRTTLRRRWLRSISLFGPRSLGRIVYVIRKRQLAKLGRGSVDGPKPKGCQRVPLLILSVKKRAAANRSRFVSALSGRSSPGTPKGRTAARIDLFGMAS